MKEEKYSPSGNDESVANIEDMTVIDEVMDESNEKDRDPVIDQIPADGLEIGTKDEVPLFLLCNKLSNLSNYKQ